LADDLRAAGAEVRSYDPAIPGSSPDTATAVAGADVVLSVNTAKVALEVAAEAVTELGEEAVFADLNTAAPALKRELAALVGPRFADVALLGPVPARGLGTRALASGSRAQTFADVVGPLGMPVWVVSEQAGDAAAMKLVRSVFMKGLAASAVESIRAAGAAGCADWLADEIAEVIGRPLLDRLLEGSERHAARRVDEMEAAAELLRELGVEPHMAAASATLLSDLAG
jgi:3-hydroxyisobutyrate dehydrogenase-like beta-hydroxyacid dehydrogenase